MRLLQIELDKTAMAFRKAHMEREELIQQWEHTIDQMKRRDADMDRCAGVRHLLYIIDKCYVLYFRS